MKYLIGTRGSKLALVQTDYVIDKLKRAYPDDDFKAVIIKTTGDLEQKKSLDKIGSKGIFVGDRGRAFIGKDSYGSPFHEGYA